LPPLTIFSTNASRQTLLFRQIRDADDVEAGVDMVDFAGDGVAEV
jgi:hypothetical protein